MLIESLGSLKSSIGVATSHTFQLYGRKSLTDKHRTQCPSVKRHQRFRRTGLQCQAGFFEQVTKQFKKERKQNADVVLATPSRSPREVVTAFYAAVNAKDIPAAIELIAEECVYEDFTYPEPKVGRENIRQFLDTIKDYVPDDLKYIIDDYTERDAEKVGIVWHVELDGVPFPNARGCSFYRINSAGQIVYARDIVESPLKLGDNAIQLLGVLTPLVRQFGTTPPELPVKSITIWAIYIAYLTVVIGGEGLLPGTGIANTPPEVWTTLFDMSLNFFYVNIAAHALGISFIPSPAESPVYEAMFNTINAWSLMFLPVFLTDRRSASMKAALPLWFGVFFLTSVFFMPYLALREAQPPVTQRTPRLPTPSWTPLIGWTGFAIAGVSLFWAFQGRPEFGDLTARAGYFQTMFLTDRPFFAFVLDATLFSLWQAYLLEDAAPLYRYVPFFGLAAWLVKGRPDATATQKTS